VKPIVDISHRRLPQRALRIYSYKPLSLSVADRTLPRLRGLLGTDKLNENQGLWIMACGSVHTFGMRYAIDVLYLNRQHTILKVVQQLLPNRLSGCLKASQVIELAGGVTAQLGIKTGMKLSLSETSTNSWVLQ
jgi:uncharacterized protein